MLCQFISGPESNRIARGTVRGAAVIPARRKTSFGGSDVSIKGAPNVGAHFQLKQNQFKMSSFRSFGGRPAAKTEPCPIFIHFFFFLSSVNYYLLFCHLYERIVLGAWGGSVSLSRLLNWGQKLEGGPRSSPSFALPACRDVRLRCRRRTSQIPDEHFWQTALGDVTEGGTLVGFFALVPCLTDMLSDIHFHCVFFFAGCCPTEGQTHCFLTIQRGFRKINIAMPLPGQGNV